MGGGETKAGGGRQDGGFRAGGPARGNDLT